jgi:hypothetical protein
MRVVRVIIYDMSPENIVKQLSGSLPDGVKEFGIDRKITVFTLGILPSSIELLMEKEEPKDAVDPNLEDFNTAGGDN